MVKARKQILFAKVKGTRTRERPRLRCTDGITLVTGKSIFNRYKTGKILSEGYTSTTTAKTDKIRKYELLFVEGILYYYTRPRHLLAVL